MPEQLFYHVFSTPAGWMGVLASPDGLREITLPQESEAKVRRLLAGKLPKAVSSPEQLADLSRRLAAYFEGQNPLFPDRLDFSGATDFRVKVWQAARDVPYGHTISYRHIAEKIGMPRAARAVGQALAKNPLPVIIPCHRIVASNGGLGGFSGGLPMKKKLLDMEKSPKTGC